MSEISTIIQGALRATDPTTMPTRIIRAHVCNVTYGVEASGVPRTLVDAVGTTTREPIVRAVVLGWSGLSWQALRMPLTPTLRNLANGYSFSEDPADRMGEMVVDPDSSGWDGDEVLIGLYGRQAIVLGTIEHAWAFRDVSGSVEVGQGQRLQDSSLAAYHRLYVAASNTHPDGLTTRWGRWFTTLWQERGVVGELRSAGNDTVPVEATALVRLQASDEWVWAQAKRLRLELLTVVSEAEEAGQTYLQLAGESNSTPDTDETTPGIAGVVGGIKAFAASDDGDAAAQEYGGEQVSATRWPEYAQMVTEINDQLSALRGAISDIGDRLSELASHVSLIDAKTPPPPVFAGPALAVFQAQVSTSTALLPVDLETVVHEGGAVLAGARSDIFRVGR